MLHLFSHQKIWYISRKICFGKNQPSHTRIFWENPNNLFWVMGDLFPISNVVVEHSDFFELEGGHTFATIIFEKHFRLYSLAKLFYILFLMLYSTERLFAEETCIRKSFRIWDQSRENHLKNFFINSFLQYFMTKSKLQICSRFFEDIFV